MLISEYDTRQRARTIGRMARAARTTEPEKRLAIIDKRLDESSWPKTDLTLVAVDAKSGKTAKFTRDSGVSLREAAAASCAVPMTWPPVEIGGKLYMDGSVRSYDNADLAAGSGKVLLISPLGPKRRSARRALEVPIEKLTAAGTKSKLVEPDENSQLAIGRNPLAPESRIPAAEAGLQQGRGLAPELGSFWS